MDRRSQRPVLCFAREAGGAEAIAPVIKLLAPMYPVILLAKDYAADVFARHALRFRLIPGYSPDLMEAIVQENGLPGAVFTSATSLPWNDMTERYLWNWAREVDIPSIAVLDQWQNYALRFSGITNDEHLLYIPSYICTMDDYARRRMIAEGIPGQRIVVCGQPAFDALIQYSARFPQSRCEQIRGVLGIHPDEKLVLFVCECLARDFGDSLGYTESSTLAALLEALSHQTAEGQKLRVIVKLHPQNRLEDLSDLDFGRYSQLRIQVLQQEIPSRDLVMVSDLVVGMASVLLIESILLGKITVSVQIACTKRDYLVATEMGAIPLVETLAQLEELLASLLGDDRHRREYLQTQNRLQTDGKASVRVASLVGRTLNEFGGQWPETGYRA